MSEASKLPELIDDRELKSMSEDAFRHQDVSCEVVELIRHVEMPANIALYGAWGSGKTGLANLIAAHFPRRDSKAVRFVRFDAFKYAEKPLRRHFLSQVAKSLQIKNPDFRENLYRDKKDIRLTVPVLGAVRVLGFFVGAIVVLAAVVMAFIVLAAAVAEGDFQSNLSDFAKSGLALGFAPASFIAAFLALAGKGFPVEYTQTRADSEEEFEDLFLRLRSEANTERLVVFIDELDRCPPDEVVSTLETLRTFLGVSGCVFIVAADQQVLERALRLKLEQATPIDTTNPYYSAGSGYLDKTFHYQLQLPPLRTPRLTKYAIELVSKRQGLWQRIDQGETIPVLIPTHVRSPRRVKALLNSFALLYRLAERRVDAGDLRSDIRPRSAELAKLTCLRTEFPLFAADLTLDARLPEYVLALHNGEQLPAHVRPEVAQRARLYAAGRLPVDEPLVEQTEESQSVSRHPVATPDVAAPEDPDAQEMLSGATNENGDVVVPSNGDDPTVLPEAAERVRAAQAEQLFAYLQKTDYISGPAQDLIYLESGGAVHGLDESVAQGLEEAAVNGDRDAVRQSVTGLDEAGQLAALEHLADFTREASHYGVEGRNAASCLLVAVGAVPDLDLEPAVSKIADAIATQQARYALTTGDMSGALGLGLRAHGAFGDGLLKQVMASDDAESSEVGLAITRAADRLETVDRGRVVEVIAARFAARDTRVAEALPDDDVAGPLLSDAVDEYSRRLPATDPDEDPNAELYQAERKFLESTLDELRAKPGTAASCARLLLRLDTSRARTAVRQRLETLGPITDVPLALGVLNALQRRALSEFPQWLDSLHRTSPGLDDLTPELDSLVERLWALSIAEDSEPENVTAALSSFGRLVSRDPSFHASVASRAEADAASSPTTAGDSRTHAFRLWVAQQFATHGLLEWSDFTTAALEKLAEPLVQAFPGVPDEDLLDHLAEWLPKLASDATPAGRESAAVALADSSWLPSPQKETLRLQVSALQRAAGETSEPPLSWAEILAFRDQHGQNSARAIGVLLEGFPHNPEDVAVLLEPFVTSQLPAPLADGLRAYSGSLDPSRRVLLADQALRGILTAVPHSSFVEASRLAEGDHEQLTDQLVAQFEKASNNFQREHILQFWNSLALDDAARRRLIESVALPMIEGSAQGLEMVARRRGALLPVPHGVRGKLRDALKEAARTKQTKAAAERLLLDLSLQKTGLMGRRKDTD